MNEVAQELEAALTVKDQLLALSDDTAAYKPAPEKWSKKEILGHLIDSAANNHQRFVRLQLQEHLELPGYAQEGWVQVQAYQTLPWSELVDLWSITNRHLAHLIRTVNPSALRNTWTAPDGTVVDLEFIMRDYVVHLNGHLSKILK